MMFNVGCALIIVFCTSFLFDKWNVALVGEIFAGVLIGPHVLNLIYPFDDAFQFVASIALYLMIGEGGLNSDFEVLKKFAKFSVAIAVFGTVLPIIFGAVFFSILKYGVLAAVIGGTALSSSSMGTSLRLLNDNKALQTPMGASLVAASMLDDIISLIAMSVLLAIGNANQNEDDLSVVATSTSNSTQCSAPSYDSATQQQHSSLAVAIIAPIGFAVAFTCLSLLLLKLITPFVCRRLPTKIVHNRRLLLITLVIVVFFGSMLAENFGGSGLVATFLLAFAFSESKARNVWNEDASQGVRIFERLFFVAVGAALPIQTLFQLDTIGFGLIYSFLSFVGKFVCGFGASDVKQDFLAIGFAMVARGELGFLMLREALDSSLIDDRMVAICCWALILNTLLAPFLFSFALMRNNKDHSIRLSVADIEFESFED